MKSLVVCRHRSRLRLCLRSRRHDSRSTPRPSCVLCQLKQFQRGWWHRTRTYASKRCHCRLSVPRPPRHKGISAVVVMRMKNGTAACRRATSSLPMTQRHPGAARGFARAGSAFQHVRPPASENLGFGVGLGLDINLTLGVCDSETPARSLQVCKNRVHRCVRHVDKPVAAHIVWATPGCAIARSAGTHQPKVDTIFLARADAAIACLARSSGSLMR